ncbi:unnamed protein product [Protopolystoma xenopodis]|uniref:Uncharacterized protein n=1 Tax=Protopolystoma xenopodis TaxID=117903 RepID=A0A3S5B108_9PLAT|nr:unnamed protein product [Protopolystoma xenopodis]
MPHGSFSICSTNETLDNADGDGGNKDVDMSYSKASQASDSASRVPLIGQALNVDEQSRRSQLVRQLLQEESSTAAGLEELSGCVVTRLPEDHWQSALASHGTDLSTLNVGLDSTQFRPGRPVESRLSQSRHKSVKMAPGRQNEVRQRGESSLSDFRVFDALEGSQPNDSFYDQTLKRR